MVLGGDLYLCGGVIWIYGIDFIIVISFWDIDKYSKEFDMWEKVVELDIERYVCGVVVVGKIYIVYLVCWFNVLLVNWEKF